MAKAIAGVCPCGGHLNDSQHEVKTLAAAQRWDASLTEADLPVRIWQRKCRACGRLEIRWNTNLPTKEEPK